MLRNHFYYAVKPFVPSRVRLGLRRWVAKRKREVVMDCWPIAPGSERPPQGWQGWPDGKQFAFLLTHDVEGPEGLAKCRKLMELEMKLGFRSAFNFVPQGAYNVSSEFRAELVRNGFEVGVHDLYHNGKLFLRKGTFKRNAIQVNRYLKDWNAVGFRSAFMLRELDWIHDLNVQYDCSTFDTDPFEPQPQGQNTIFPFWVPRRSQTGSDSSAGAKSSGYLELPYTLPQDSTLFLMLGERHPDIWFQKLDWIASHGGMGMVNVHPDYICFEGETPAMNTYPVDHYRRLLEYVAQRYAKVMWQGLPRELSAWYRSQMVREHSGPNRTVGLQTGKPVGSKLAGRKAAVVLYSGFPSDPRPRRELESLCAEGVSVDLICLRDDPEQASEETSDNLRVTRLGIQHKRSGKLRYFSQYAQFFIISFALLSWRTLRRRYDLVHVHNMPDFLVFSALVPRLSGARIILDLHDPMPELYQTIFDLRPSSLMVRSLERIEGASIGFAHLVLTPNEAFRQLFCSRGCPTAKLQIIMNTPDESLFTPDSGDRVKDSNSSSKKGFHVMFHGLIAARHGLATATTAIAKASKAVPGIVFDVYGGKNAYLEEVTRLAANLGLGNQFVYHGKRPIEKIPEAILAADIGIIPNSRTPFTEVNFPTRIFEYLSLGKPLIVPRTKGITDYFKEDEILFFEPDNADDLAEKLVWAYLHPEELQALVERGRKVYDQHRWQAERQRFLGLVSGLLGKRDVSGEPSGTVLGEAEEKRCSSRL